MPGRGGTGLRPAGAAVGLLLAGMLVMGAAALRSGRYTPVFIDPDDGPPCTYTPDGCPADLDAALAGLWWWVGAGGLLATAGALLLVAALPGGRGRPARPAPALVHAAVAGVAAVVLAVVGGLPALVLLLAGGDHAVPAVLAGIGLAQAGVLAALAVALGGRPAPRTAWCTGLAVSAGAVGLAVVGASGPASGDVWWTVVRDDATAVAVGVLLVRLTTDRWPASRGGVLLRTACVVAALVPVAAVLAGVASPDTDPRARPAPPAPVAVPPAPLPTPAPAPAVPEPVADAPPPPVDADVPCAPEDLDLTVVGFDGALGARAASVQARNTGVVPCWVEGVPVVTLLQGRRPLTLTVEPGRAPGGGPAVVERVGIAPGGTALSLLTWRTYAGWADAETPQAVTVALDPAAPPVEAGIVGGSPAAPFDLADGGTWGIAPWAPPW